MNLEGHYDWRRSPPKMTYSSLILLVVFVAAAGFLAGATLERPWADDGATTAQAQFSVEPPALPALSDSAGG